MVLTGYFKLLQMLFFSAINNIFWCSCNWSCRFFLALTTYKNVSLWGQWLHSWSMLLMDSSYLTTYHIRSYNVYMKTEITNVKILITIIWGMFISTHHLFENELNCFNFNHVLWQYIQQYNNTEPGSLTALFLSRPELLLFSVSSDRTSSLSHSAVLRKRGNLGGRKSIIIPWNEGILSPSALGTFHSRLPFVICCSD